MLILEQKLVLQGKTTSAASGKCPKFPIYYNIAKDSFLIGNSFTNNFFIFISLSVYFLRQMLIWPGGEFTRWPTRLSYAGVCVLRLAFNLLQMKFLDNKNCDEQDTCQCHLLQSLKITPYSAPFLNSKRKHRVLPQHNLERDQLFQLF